MFKCSVYPVKVGAVLLILTLLSSCRAFTYAQALEECQGKPTGCEYARCRAEKAREYNREYHMPGQCK